MKLYHHPLSGHSHRARLFLALLDVEHEEIEINPAKGEHKTPAFLQLNPFGQIPVLVDGDDVIPDSNAILVYLARKFARTDWLPEAPAEAAAVHRWLSVAANEIANGPCAARLATVFGYPINAGDAIARAHAVLKIIDGVLAGKTWIAAAHPTIADVALYSYISSAPEGNVDLAAYPHVREWLTRFEKLPGFLAFQKTPIGLAANA